MRATYPSSLIGQVEAYEFSGSWELIASPLCGSGRTPLATASFVEQWWGRGRVSVGRTKKRGPGE